MNKKWIVYILECTDGTYYTGITTNLENRIKAHSSKKGAKYTSQRLPVKLCYSVGGYSQSEARKEEFRIKNLKRSEKERIIMAKNNKKITICKDGPYIVTGKVPLNVETIGYDGKKQGNTWIKGKKFPIKGEYSLCRCGKSINKPFCTGHHITEDFDGTETADNIKFDEKAGIIEGPTLYLKDVEEFCVGAGFCHRAQGTWQAVRESNDPQARQIAIEEAADCPSGRLVVCDKSGKEIKPKFDQKISIVNDSGSKDVGPIWVKGGVPIKSASGEEYEVRNRITLCRCGKSKNKPFCDSSHLS